MPVFSLFTETDDLVHNRQHFLFVRKGVGIGQLFFDKSRGKEQPVRCDNVVISLFLPASALHGWRVEELAPSPDFTALFSLLIPPLQGCTI